MQEPYEIINGLQNFCGSTLLQTHTMDSDYKPHAVCIPAPSPGHIKAVLKVAKLLHHRGFHITFVNTEPMHNRFLKSQGPNSLDGLPNFRFETIPDGLPDSDADPMGLICKNNHMKTLLPPFRDLLIKLNNNDTNPPVTCIVSDGFLWMFTTAAAQEIGVPIALFHTIAASTFMGFKQYRTLLQKGLAPLKDESCFTNGFLDRAIDYRIPGMKDIRLKDLPSFFRTTDPNDAMFEYLMATVENVHKASAVAFITFDALEQDILDAFSSMFDPPTPVYAIGPLQLLLNQMPNDPLKQIGYSLWKEEPECLQWLHAKAPNSVVYVNFGSVAILTPKQLVEFGWGLANSKHPFIWVIRPDLVMGESATLPPEFVAETKERSLIASWCPQEEVLNHPSVGGFLTHSGWHSTVESLTAGVPMLCWPCFADQQTNCFMACNQWGIGMEISSDVKRDEVEKLVRDLMEGEKGKNMRKKVLDWKKLAEDATAPHGSSSENLDNLVNKILLRKM